MQRQHLVGGQPLTERVQAHEALEFADQFSAAPRAQVGIDPVLDGTETQFLQPLYLCGGKRLERELLQRMTTPQCERFAQHEGGRARVMLQERPSLARE